MDLATLLTQIGAATGFITFVFKGVEFFRDRRPSLRISPHFTSDPERGNTILILNSSKIPTTINYYQLEALPPSRLARWHIWRRFPAGFSHVEFTLEADHAKVEVPAHGQAALVFDQQDHFRWSRRDDDLYLRIWTSGRARPYSFLVAKADKPK